jgi:nitroimidazol reductase NimA-like FMN-containing flavoprotein (pyridoxamine 5'-phosphate oxidase superfamily)
MAILELTKAEIDELLHEQVVGRVGCHVDGLTYVVPLIYAYDGDAIYIASIGGLKVEMMRANPQVCFEVDEYSPGGWRSAIVQGDYEELEGEDVSSALDLLQRRFGRSAGESNRRLLSDTTVVFRIVVREVTGRAVRR